MLLAKEGVFDLNYLSVDKPVVIEITLLHVVFLEARDLLENFVEVFLTKREREDVLQGHVHEVALFVVEHVIVPNYLAAHHSVCDVEVRHPNLRLDKVKANCDGPLANKMRL